VDAAKTLAEYRARLQILLDGVAAKLRADESSVLRAIVRQRRNGRRNQEPLRAAPCVRECAGEIVALLEAAARELRPRETQELDDLVAGQPAKTDPPPSVPVRMHRSGWPSR
jgi:hypothetical protein